MADGALELRLMLTAGVFVAGVGVLASLFLFAVSRTTREPLFPPVGPVRAPGNGLVVVAAFAMLLLTSGILQSALESTGFFRAIYGAEGLADFPEQTTRTVHYLWAAGLAFPVQLIAILAVIRVQGGLAVLSLRGWTRHAMAGYLTWLMVTPIAFCVFALANLANFWLTDKPPDKHPLTALGDASGKLEWTIFVVQTVVLAPVLEELLFRGLLLPWLAQTRITEPDSPLTVPPSKRSLAVMLLAVGIAVLFHIDNYTKAWVADNRNESVAHLIPGVFFVCLIPLLFAGPAIARLRRHLRIRSVHRYQAIVASSALFAAVHAQVWPSPVPLFVLALGLGYLYLRSRSLVGPIVVHGMFNAVSAVYLLIGGHA